VTSVCCASVLLLTGCAAKPSYDYTAFKRNGPRSILILPPVNDSTAVGANYSLMSQMTLPLAESGYYVLPVTLVDETFRQNGLNDPTDIAMVPTKKLHEIFGADAALYVHVKQYGTSYQVVSSVTTVTAVAKLVDLRSGELLWEGHASAIDNGQAANVGGIVGMLVAAVVNQIMASTFDRSHDVAGVASVNLLAAGRPGGMLYGPRSPNYQKE
jgi:hypothetical protein